MANYVTFKGKEPILFKIAYSGSALVNSVDDLVHQVERPTLGIYFPIDTPFDTLVQIYQDSDALSEICLSQDHMVTHEVPREATEEEKAQIIAQMEAEGQTYDGVSPLTVVDVVEENQPEQYVHVNYVIKIGLKVEYLENEEVWCMSLGQLTETDIALRQIAGVIAKKTNFLTFEEYQKAKIEQSKVDLADFLSEHPLVSNCFHDEWHKFNATAEHRNLFVTHYYAHMMKVQSGLFPDDKMSWNISGQECVDWTDAEALGYTVAMDAYVTPLVHAQQRFEIAVRNAKTKEDLDKIQIDYSKVETPNGDPALVHD